MPRSAPRRSAVRLVKVVKSPRKGKKLRAVFRRSNGREFSRDFGDASMSDYTRHHDKQRRANYLSRHRHDTRTGDPTRAGYLSKEILWGSSTSLRANVAAYKRRHGL
jgi:hypothetical protein